MIKLIIVGCSGAMGRMLVSTAKGEKDLEIAAGIDIQANTEAGFPVFPSLKECTVKADAVIDFSTAKISDLTIDYCMEKKLPLVLATTGLSPEQLKHCDEAGKVIPLVQSFNMSLGVNTLANVLKQITPILSAAGFDIEIVEQHHNKKKDAPSGTAILLANAANSSVENRYHYVYDRSSASGRNSDEIGISSVRGGTIAGIHDVIFAGEDEVVELKHQAFSKAVFAKGAFTAARFLIGRAPGRYSMSDVIG